jgi:hypothetical protein
MIPAIVTVDTPAQGQPKTSLRDPAWPFWRSMILENRYPPRIKSGAGFFGIML